MILLTSEPDSAQLFNGWQLLIIIAICICVCALFRWRKWQ